MTNTGPSALTLVVCAAPLADRAADIASEFIAAGWRVRVVATPLALSWISAGAVETATGTAPASTQGRPDREARQDFAESAVLVAPLTFNSLNKWALGIADNYALGVLCEAISVGRPAAAVPMIGRRFWGHPATSKSLELLRIAGVSMVSVAGGGDDIGPLPSGAGPSLASSFDPSTLVKVFT